MKRFLIVCAALLVTSVSLFAAKPLRVASGSLDILRQDVTATWFIDLSEAVFEKDGSFKTWCGEDYDIRVKLMNDAFFEGFRKYSTGIKLVNEGDAPYKIVLKIREFERKQGPGMWGSAFIRIFGTFEVTDKVSGETVLVMDVDGVKGDTDFVETDRFPKTIDWFVRDLFKLKK